MLIDHEHFNFSWIQAFEFGIRIAEALLDKKINTAEANALLNRMRKKEQCLNEMPCDFSSDLLASVTLSSYHEEQKRYKEMLQGRIENYGRDSVDAETLEKWKL